LFTIEREIFGLFTCFFEEDRAVAFSPPALKTPNGKYQRLFRLFSAVFAASLTSFGDACGVERTTNDVITDARKISDPAASYENGTVFLKVVTFAGNVDRTFLLVGKTYSCDLTHSGVRLFGGCRRDGKAYASSLRTFIQNRSLALFVGCTSAVLDKLVDCGHFLPPYKIRNFITRKPSSKNNADKNKLIVLFFVQKHEKYDQLP